MYPSDPTFANPLDTHCNICNLFNYATDTMTNARQRTLHIQDSPNIYEDINAKDLPAVSIVKPGWPSDGHPASSKLELFAAFVKNIINGMQGAA